MSSSVRFFLIQKFFGEEPQGQHTQCDVMMPPFPISHLIVGKTTLAFCSMKTFFNAIRLFDHSGVFVKVSRFIVPRRFAKGKPISPVITSWLAIVFTPLAHDQSLFIADFIFNFCTHLALHQLDRQPTFVTLTNLDRQRKGVASRMSCRSLPITRSRCSLVFSSEPESVNKQARQRLANY